MRSSGRTPTLFRNVHVEPLAAAGQGPAANCLPVCSFQRIIEFRLLALRAGLIADRRLLAARAVVWVSARL